MDGFFEGARRWSVRDVAQFLTRETALTVLATDDAIEVVRRMQPSRVAAGTVLLREGDRPADFMLFLLEGEAVVETAAGHGEPMILKWVGPGGLIGEQGIVDNDARSATVTAATDVAVAVLTQQAFAQLVREHPGIACSLLAQMLGVVSERLRAANRRMKMLHRLNTAMEEQVSATTGGAPLETGAHASGDAAEGPGSERAKQP